MYHEEPNSDMVALVATLVVYCGETRAETKKLSSSITTNYFSINFQSIIPTLVDPKNDTGSSCNIALLFVTNFERKREHQSSKWILILYSIMQTGGMMCNRSN